MSVTAEPFTPIIPASAVALAMLSECVCNEIATTGAGPVCWCGLWPGAEVSWEYCSDCPSDHCGMAWVRLTNVFPFDTFPIPSLDDRCIKSLGMAVEVGALRCLPTPADGNIVDPAEMNDVAMAVAIDAFALYRAVACCDLSEVSTVHDASFVLGQYTALGPQGGCVGGSWQAFLAIN